jgi:hypothetical protein
MAEQIFRENTYAYETETIADRFSVPHPRAWRLTRSMLEAAPPNRRFRAPVIALRTRDCLATAREVDGRKRRRR